MQQAGRAAVLEWLLRNQFFGKMEIEVGNQHWADYMGPRQPGGLKTKRTLKQKLRLTSYSGNAKILHQLLWIPNTPFARYECVISRSMPLTQEREQSTLRKNGCGPDNRSSMAAMN